MKESLNSENRFEIQRQDQPAGVVGAQGAQASLRSRVQLLRLGQEQECTAIEGSA